MCMYIFPRICIRTHLLPHTTMIGTYISTYTHIYTFTYIHISVSIHLHLYLNTYTCMCQYSLIVPWHYLYHLPFPSIPIDLSICHIHTCVYKVIYKSVFYIHIPICTYTHKTLLTRGVSSPSCLYSYIIMLASVAICLYLYLYTSTSKYIYTCKYKHLLDRASTLFVLTTRGVSSPSRLTGWPPSTSMPSFSRAAHSTCQAHTAPQKSEPQHKKTGNDLQRWWDKGIEGEASRLAS